MARPQGIDVIDELDRAWMERVGSAGEVVASLQRNFEAAKASDGLRYGAQGYAVVQNRLGCIPGALNDAYATSSIDFGLTEPATRSILAQTARNGGVHARYRFPDADLVVLDRDALIRSALLCFYVSLSRRHPDAMVPAAFIVAHSAGMPKRPIPFQYEILYATLKNPRTRDWFLGILNTVLDFVAIHEIGHTYAEAPTAGQDFFKLRLGQIDGTTAAFCESPSPRRDPLHVKNDPADGDALEFFCDAFALTCSSLMNAGDSPRDVMRRVLPGRLTILGDFFCLEDVIAVHGGAPSAEANLGRLKLANRRVPTGQPFEHGFRPFRSHPSPPTRIASLIGHAGWIARALDGERDPFDDLIDEAFMARVRAAWNPGVRLLLDMRLDTFNRAAFDHGGAAWSLNLSPTASRIFDEIADAAVPGERNYPELMKALCVAAFAGELLSSEAIEEGPARRELEAMSRVPPSSRMAALAVFRDDLAEIGMAVCDPVAARARIAAAAGERGGDAR